MKKLIHLWCLLCLTISLAAQDIPDATKTYSVSVKITKGLLTKQLITRKDTDRTFYQKTYYDSPAYTLKLTDAKGNLLFENNYGGSRESIDWGKSQKFTTSDAAYQVWREMREKVWKELELTSIDLTKMKADVMTFFNDLNVTEKADFVAIQQPTPKKTDPKPQKPNEQNQATVSTEKQLTTEKPNPTHQKPIGQKPTTVIAKKKTTPPSEKTRTNNLLIKLVGSGIY